MSLQLRSVVRLFAEMMEARLRANNHKPGWRNDDLHDLLFRLQEEREELIIAMLGEDADAVLREAADVANFAMMIADVYPLRLAAKQAKEKSDA